MPIPFNRTIKQIKNNGLKKTVTLFAIETLTEVIKKTRKFHEEEQLIVVNKTEMIVVPSKGAIHKDLFLYKKREPICTDFLLHSGVIKKGDTVLDIGANIGYYALAEARIVGETGKVYAVEPVLGNFEILQKNIALNNFTNVPAFQYAFGDRNDRIEIFVSSSANLCAINKDATWNIVGVEQVPMMTIDDFIKCFVKDKKMPKLIRMDVEGYEYEILKGMNNTLKTNVNILMELHPLPRYLSPKKLEEIYLILENNNYRAKFVVFENKVNENWLLKFLYKQSGEKLPIVASNISMKELRTLVKENQHLAAPNIFFEKEIK